jgi:hypothetical protein
MKLNARQVEAAKPKEKPYKLADGGGLYLLVNPNGSRYWRLKYRVAGKEKLLALGVYPEVTLADARAKRDEAKRGIAARCADPFTYLAEQLDQRAITLRRKQLQLISASLLHYFNHTTRVRRSVTKEPQ